MNLRISSLHLLLFITAFACNGRIIYVNQHRDPELASAIKLDNLEKFGGNWIFTEINRSIYLQISDEGYYWTMNEANSDAMGGDYGEIFHDKPGLMTFASGRQDCQSKVEMNRGNALFSPMANGIKLSSAIQNEKIFALAPVDRQVHIDALPCVVTTGAQF